MSQSVNQKSICQVKCNSPYHLRSKGQIGRQSG